MQPDGSSGPLPTIRLVSPPGNGTVSIKRGKVTATNYAQWRWKGWPSSPKPDFPGVDTLTLEVKFPHGRNKLQRITINVGAAAAGQKI